MKKIEKIKIEKNPNGDSRTAPKDVTFEQFHEANVGHITDVNETMSALAIMLANNGENHDWTKLEYEKEFYDNFVDTINNGTDFVSNTWYQKHIQEEKHHPFSKCHDDINLLDIIETIVDCVCAGKAYSKEKWTPQTPWDYWMKKCEGLRAMHKESEYLIKKLLWNLHEHDLDSFVNWYNDAKDYLEKEYNKVTLSIESSQSDMLM